MKEKPYSVSLDDMSCVRYAEHLQSCLSSCVSLVHVNGVRDSHFSSTVTFALHFTRDVDDSTKLGVLLGVARGLLENVEKLENITPRIYVGNYASGAFSNQYGKEDFNLLEMRLRKDLRLDKNFFYIDLRVMVLTNTASYTLVKLTTP